MSNSAKVQKLLRELSFPAGLLSADLSRLELTGKEMTIDEFDGVLRIMRKYIDRLEELIKNTRAEVK